MNQLHLWAPGWEDEDQKQPWDPPRGFLKWLRDSGPVVGCEVRGGGRCFFLSMGAGCGQRAVTDFSEEGRGDRRTQPFYVQNGSLVARYTTGESMLRFLCRSGETLVGFQHTKRRSEYNRGNPITGFIMARLFPSFSSRGKCASYANLVCGSFWNADTWRTGTILPPFTCVKILRHRARA